MFRTSYISYVPGEFFCPHKMGLGCTAWNNEVCTAWNNEVVQPGIIMFLLTVKTVSCNTSD